jgi:hypothetical protein
VPARCDLEDASVCFVGSTAIFLEIVFRGLEVAGERRERVPLPDVGSGDGPPGSAVFWFLASVDFVFFFGTGLISVNNCNSFIAHPLVGKCFLALVW